MQLLYLDVLTFKNQQNMNGNNNQLVLLHVICYCSMAQIVSLCCVNMSFL